MPFTRAACTPSDGLKNTVSFPTTPTSETAARKQVQDVIDQAISAINTLESELEATAGAANLGCSGSYSNLQAFINAVESAGTGTTPGANVVTDAMLNTANKTGLLATLTTTVKTSFALAINEVVASIGTLASLSTTAKTSIVAAINELVTNYSYRTGEAVDFYMSTAPTGFLKANGAAVSRTTYAALFTAIGTTFGAGDGSTTFNLPDGRGVTKRGWDDGRGYDSGRVFGSYQTDDVKAHGHGFTTASGGEHTHGLNLSGLFIGSGTPANFVDGAGDEAITGSSGSHTHTGTTDNNGTATETTVKSIAVLACIKY